MKTLKKIILTTLLIALPLLGSANERHDKAPAQTTCPVMEGNPIDPSLYVDYQGKRVYLCCKPCVKLFTENPEDYLDKLPQFAEQAHPEEQATEKHDHATDHGEAGQPPKLISFAGKFHPIAVHIPIGLILVAALAEALFLFTGVPLFRSATRFNLLIAVLGAAVAVALGLAAETGTQYPPDYAVVLLRHKLLGLSTFVVILVTAVLSERLHRKQTGLWSYRIALVLGVLFVAATGHFGGMLVYGLNYFSW